MVTTTQIAVVMSLLLQNSTVFVLLRAAKVSSSGFLGSVVVLCIETLKILMCIGIVLRQEGIVGGFRSILHAYSFFIDTLKIAVPGVLYVVQNNLVVAASAYLDAPTISVLMQGKIITTAVFAVVILQKKLTWLKWQALVMLLVGVIIVQRSTQQSKSGGSAGSTDSTLAIVGLIEILLGVSLSGFNSVWFEAVIKGAKKSADAPEFSMWVKNVQLAGVGILCSIITIIVMDTDTALRDGMFVGFTPLVWGYVLDSAVGGLLASMAVKYTDSITKNFATTVATVMSAVLSIVFLDFPLSIGFVVGGSLVFGAVFLYSSKTASGTETDTPAPTTSTATASSASTSTATATSSKTLPVDVEAPSVDVGGFKVKVPTHQL